MSVIDTLDRPVLSPGPVGQALPRRRTPRPRGRAATGSLLRSYFASTAGVAVVRIGITMLTIVVAYQYSLRTLMRSLKYDSPLAYLGLVPILAVGIAVLHARPVRAEPAIHDRSLDYIVGLPFIVAALAINLLLPERLSTMFWVWRIDLMSFPLFVAGSIALVFGVRTLWRLKFAVLFLVLAFPVPYRWLLLSYLGPLTDLTLVGIRAGLRVFDIAAPQAGGTGALFDVGSGPERFVVSVASSCSGVNSVVGFLIMACALAPLVLGKLWNKVAWFATGLVAIWGFNVLRILVIFLVGNLWGEGVAINGFHPFLGLVTFNLGTGVMLLLMKAFRLKFRAVQLPWTGDDRSGTRGRGRPASTLVQAVPRARLALTVVLVAGLLLATANAGFRSYDLVASDLGAPKLEAFTKNPSRPDGWGRYAQSSYPWASRFFGNDAKWTRWVYEMSGVGTPKLVSSSAIIADVIKTSDLNSFSTYGIEACYQFHGYKLGNTRSVKLGGGVIGHVLSYTNTKLKSDWTNLYWYWPVKDDEGTRYERINLLVLDGASVGENLPAAKPNGSAALGSRSAEAKGSADAKAQVSKSQRRTEEFLVKFARALVDGQISASAESAEAGTGTVGPEGRL